MKGIIGKWFIAVLLVLVSIVGVRFASLENDNIIIEDISKTKNPKVFRAWSPSENRNQYLDSNAYLDAAIYNKAKDLAVHDLVFGHLSLMGTVWQTDEQQPYPKLSTSLVDFHTGEDNLETALSLKKATLEINPEFKVLAEVHFREEFYVDPMNITLETDFWDRGGLPFDSHLWLRDKAGQLIPSWGEDTNLDGSVSYNEAQACLVDFRKSDFQQLFVDKVVAIQASGVFDGILIDCWRETEAVAYDTKYNTGYINREEQIEAMVALLKKVRKAVGDDFLILANTAYDKVAATDEYLNGFYMECYKALDEKGYTDVQLRKIESNLKWAESHVSSPKINCLEVWRDAGVYNADLQTRLGDRNSVENLKLLRMFTALMLTHSEGYILFADNGHEPSTDHLHNYYDLWDVDLGKAQTPSAVQLKGYEHVYIREYETHIVIYNGSPREAKYGNHLIPAYDGLIFLSND